MNFTRPLGAFGPRTIYLPLLAVLSALPAHAQAPVRGLQWTDFDGDGQQDVLTVVPSGRSRVYRGSERSFVPVGAEQGLGDLASVTDAEWLDFDGDGHVDLSLTLADGARLLRNVGRGFEEVDLGFRPTFVPPRPPSAPEIGGPGTPGQDTSFSASGGTQAASLPGGTQAMAQSTCASGIDDLANPGSCLSASSVPMLGSLYPISDQWFIDGSGRGGIGNVNP